MGKPEEAYRQMRTMCDRVRGCIRSSVPAVSRTLPREIVDQVLTIVDPRLRR